MHLGRMLLMGVFVSILIQGISYGLVLFLIATGMTLTMGLLRVVNMSHGAIFLISGYVGVFVYKVSAGWAGGGLSDMLRWVIAAVAATLVGGILGFLIEKGLLNRLYSSPQNQVLLTIGLIYIITNVVLWMFGGEPAGAPIPEFFGRTVLIGAVTVPYIKLFIIIFGAIIAVLLWLIQDKTKLGATVRAGMDNGVIAGTLGINKKVIFTAVFVIGSAIAGLSSIVGGTLITMDQSTSWNVLLNSIIVVVVGGAGSIQGALLSGLLLGIIDAFGMAYCPVLTSFLFYIVLIIVLVIRPQGLLGRKADVDKASDDYTTNRVMHTPTFAPFMLGSNIPGKLKTKLNAYKAAPYIFVLIVAIVLPFITGASTQNILAQVLVYILFAASLDVVMGYTGNRSFGHAAYFGMGAYVVGLLGKHFNITSFWIILPVTIIACAILSAIIGYFTLRLSGTNFLLVTMAFGQLLYALAAKLNKITGGTDGLIGVYRPNFGFGAEACEKWDSFWMKRAPKGEWYSKFFTPNFRIYFFILIVVIICFLLLKRFMKSSFGASLLGVRGNEGRMRALGYNTWKLRYTGIIVAGIFAGIAGMLYAYLYKTLVPSLFALETSAMPMLMVIMGGGGTLWGPALSATIIMLAKNYSTSLIGERWPLVMGIIFVLCVIFLPNGLSPYLKKFWAWVGSKIFKKEMAEAGEVGTMTSKANLNSGKEAK